MSDLPSFTVACNGVPVDRAAWGQLPVDPKRPRFKATADGYNPWEREYDDLPDATKLTVEIPKLEAILIDGPKRPPETPKGTSKQKVASFAIGGAGIVALGIGGYFGVRTFSQWDEAMSHCENGAKTRCTPEGIALGESADTSALLANVLIGVGVAGVAGGVILYLTAPANSASKAGRNVQLVPTISAGYQGASLMLRF